MNIQEKQAWFALYVVAATLAAYAILFAITKSFKIATASFAISALLGAQGLVGRKERKSGRIVADERDLEINKISLGIAYSIFWVFFVGTAMAPFFILGPNATVQINATTLATIAYPAVCLLYLVRSVVIIVLYRKGRHA